MTQPQTEGLYGSQTTSAQESLSRPKTPTSNTPKREGIKLPELSQFSIACYAGFIALVALYVVHTSASTGADAAILANEIATAGIDQAQAANQIQLLQLCLLNNTLLIDACDKVLGPATDLVPNIVALSTFQYGVSAANYQLRARLTRELTGFHIVFFSFVALVLLHAVFSLWRPVKEYVRQRRVLRNRERNETSTYGSQNAITGQGEAQVLRAMGPDSDRDWQTKDIQMYQREGEYASHLLMAEPGRQHQECGLPHSPKLWMEPIGPKQSPL